MKTFAGFAYLNTNSDELAGAMANFGAGHNGNRTDFHVDTTIVDHRLSAPRLAVCNSSQDAPCKEILIEWARMSSSIKLQASGKLCAAADCVAGLQGVASNAQAFVRARGKGVGGYLVSKRRCGRVDAGGVRFFGSDDSHKRVQQARVARTTEVLDRAGWPEETGYTKPEWPARAQRC